MSPNIRDMTLDLDQIGLNLQITSLGSIHFPHINTNWNPFEEEKCVRACVRVHVAVSWLACVNVAVCLLVPLRAICSPSQQWVSR